VLVLLPESNGSHTWIPAAAVKDPKAAAVTKDENLSWEQSLEAAPHMIIMMKVQAWPDDCIKMHIQSPVLVCAAEPPLMSLI
jgi:ABC-type Fe3+-hydroxamate transport system substrate-binding protein